MPTFNEIKNKMLQSSFHVLSKVPDAEVIIVDSFSTDATVALAHSYGFKVLFTDSTSRAKRLNKGILAAKYPLILLHHPRSLLSAEAFDELKETRNVKWGAFTHQFEPHNSLLLGFTSFYSNYIRGRRGIYYFDHCLFSKRDLLLKVNLLSEIDIFEDTDLCKKLRIIAPPKLLASKSTTSAIRFQQNGLWRQSFLNQILKIKYFFKYDHKDMNKDYEEGLDLNSDYTSNSSSKLIKKEP